MALSRQAKYLSTENIAEVEEYIKRGRRYPERDICMFYFSVYAAFRAVDTSNTTWEMLTDAKGNLVDEVRITNTASKGKSGGRVVPLHPKLMAALRAFHEVCGCPSRGPLFVSERGKKFTAHVVVQRFAYWYGQLGLKGCSSHSGRRTALTNLARSINLHGGSMNDVRALAGHKHLNTTQRYIEENEEAKKAAIANL